MLSQNHTKYVLEYKILMLSQYLFLIDDNSSWVNNLFLIDYNSKAKNRQFLRLRQQANLGVSSILQYIDGSFSTEGLIKRKKIG